MIAIYKWVLLGFHEQGFTAVLFLVRGRFHETLNGLASVYLQHGAEFGFKSLTSKNST